MPKRSPKSRFFYLTIGGVALLLIAAVFLVVFKVCENQYIQNSTVLAESTQPTFLYVQTAHSGTLSAAGSDGQRTLTLHNVSPVTVYFAERPNRETGHQSTAEFVAQWAEGEDSFKTNPPNAALDIIGDDSQSIVIIELMSVKYDAVAQTLEYEVIILDDETGGAIPQSFAEAVLFIDSSYKKYHCDCELTSGETCQCKFKYTIGAGATKEFRGYCGNDLYPDSIDIGGRRKSTSCTVDFPWFEYHTRSCTNWDITSSDQIDITISCSKN